MLTERDVGEDGQEGGRNDAMMEQVVGQKVKRGQMVLEEPRCNNGRRERTRCSLAEKESVTGQQRRRRLLENRKEQGDRTKEYKEVGKDEE